MYKRQCRDQIHDISGFRDIYKNENGNVTIERDWFWRGDTIINDWVKQISENLCIVEADSKPNWHRGNGALLMSQMMNLCTI